MEIKAFLQTYTQIPIKSSRDHAVLLDLEEYIYISDRRDLGQHPPLSSKHLTLPTSPRSVKNTALPARLQAGRDGLGVSNVWKTKRGAVPSITESNKICLLSKICISSEFRVHLLIFYIIFENPKLTNTARSR